MKKFIGILLFLFLLSPLSGTVYYVDTAADPGGDGTTQGTTGGDCAWDTIADVNAASFSAGDTISFKKGCTWRETLTPPSSGSDGSLVTFGAYGAGANPIIYGSDLMTTWVADSSTENIGDNAGPGGSPGAHAANYIYFHKVTTTSAGTVSKISMYVQSAESSDNVEAAIYTDSAGEPGSVLTNGETDAVAWSHNNEWVDFTFATDPSVSATTAYWIGINTDTAFYDRAKGSGGSNNWKYIAQTYGTWPDSPSVDGTDSLDDVDVYMVVDVGLASVWKKTGVTTQPKVLIFDGTWGVYESSKANLNANYEWHWAADVLYVYTDGGDPDTQWPSGIEAGQRDFGVNINWVDYIGVDDMDIKYSNNHGIQTNTSTGSEINDCNTTMTGGFGYNFFNGDSCLLDTCTQNGGMGGCGTDSGSDNNTFQSNTFQNSRTTTQGSGIGGFHLNDSDSNILRYNLIHTAYLDGSNRNGDGFVIEDSDSNEIYYNVVYEMNDCIDINGGDSNEYYNNVSYKIRYTHWTLRAAATGNLIKNNIFYRSEVNNFFADGNEPAQGNTIDYNRYYDPDISAGSGDCISWDVSGLEEWGNMTFDAWVAQGTYDQNSTFGDPKLIDAANDDFRLLMASPCVDAGTDVSLTTDYRGRRIRHEPDIGAYEDPTNAVFMVLIPSPITLFIMALVAFGIYGRRRNGNKI